MATPVPAPLTQTYLGNVQADDIRCKTLNGVASDSFTFSFTIPVLASGAIITLPNIAHGDFKFAERIEVCGTAQSTAGTVNVNMSGVNFNTRIRATDYTGGVFAIGDVYCGKGTGGLTPGFTGPFTATVSSVVPASFTDITVKMTLSK